VHILIWKLLHPHCNLPPVTFSREAMQGLVISQNKCLYFWKIVLLTLGRNAGEAQKPGIIFSWVTGHQSTKSSPVVHYNEKTKCLVPDKNGHFGEARWVTNGA
jgi:hypothetical protein